MPAPPVARVAPFVLAIVVPYVTGVAPEQASFGAGSTATNTFPIGESDTSLPV